MILGRFLLICLTIHHTWSIVTPSDTNQEAQNAPAHLTKLLNKLSVSRSIQQLGFTLSSKESLSRNSNGNVVLSPLSISSLLGVLLLASRRETHSELKQAMGLDKISDIQIHESLRDILGSLLSGNRGGVVLQIANRLYLQDDFSVEPRFLQISESLYNTTVGKVNFGFGSSARRAINKFVADSTNNKIKNFIQRNFPRQTKFVALSVVYFNGAWETVFNPDLTDQNGVFRIDNNREIKIPFMQNALEVRYTSNDEISSTKLCDIGHFEMIALPYKGKNFSLYIIKPKGGPSANKLTLIEKSLTPECLESIIRQMRPTQVSLGLPRMTIRNKMSLKQSLQDLNVNSLFDSTKVDLGRLSSSHGLAVEDIQHEAVIILTERGTEAAAVSGVTVNKILGKFFRMDVPSIIFIRDDENDINLFWSKVVEPVPSQ